MNLPRENPLDRPLPEGVAAPLQMNEDPILKYFFLISHVPPNRWFQCKLCDFKCNGAPILAKTHLEPRLSTTNKTRKCKALIPGELRKALDVAIALKLKESNAKKAKTVSEKSTSEGNELTGIRGALLAQGAPFICIWYVRTCIHPNV